LGRNLVPRNGHEEKGGPTRESRGSPLRGKINSGAQIGKLREKKSWREIKG